MGKYHNDQPINGGVNNPDLLNRESFANHLANILLLESDDDCLTVSLEGEWGYGKTSVMNLIKTSLQKKDTPPIIIEYNPWLAGNPQSLIQDFLIQFSSQLNITHNSEVALKAAKELMSYSSLFGVAKLIPGVEPWASIAENVFKSTGSAAKDVAKLKKLDLLAKKNKVKEALSKIDSSIIVFIDDIDRLTPDETFQILRLVKAVADFSGTTFLLAFDPKYLYQALKSYHINNANEYIDKVIQLRIPLPIISDRDMNHLFTVELANLSEKELTDVFEKDQERLSWSYHKYVKHLIKNPRELKRFFNHLRFVLEQVEGQVSFNDLFCLSAIAIKANNVYTHIKSRPEAYIGKSFFKDNSSFEEPKKVVERSKKERDLELKSLVVPGVAQLIQGILGELFPLVEEEDQYYSPYDTISSKDAAGRVSAAQRLYVAFHYATPTGYISDYDILSFINGGVDRVEFVEKTIKEDSISRFFEMISNYSKECADKEFEVLCAIYDVHIMSDELRVSLEANHGFLSFNVFQQITWFTDELVSKSKNTTTLLSEIISREENAPISANLINTMRHQIEKSEEGNSHQEVWVKKDVFLKLEKKFTKVAVKVLQKKSFIKTSLEADIFYELKRSSETKISKFINEIMNKEHISRIAELIGRTGTNSSNGPYVHITEKTLEGIIDFHLLQKNANKTLLEDNSLSISLRAILQSISDGKKYYLRDGTEGRIW